MTTWEEIRDEVAGMLADGCPLEEAIAKLEQRKNEMAKANLITVFDELKKPKPMTETEIEKKWENTVWDTDVYLDDLDGKEQMTNEEWLRTATTEQLAKALMKIFITRTFCHLCPEGDVCDIGHKCKYSGGGKIEDWVEWLKQPHK